MYSISIRAAGVPVAVDATATRRDDQGRGNSGLMADLPAQGRDRSVLRERTSVRGSERIGRLIRWPRLASLTLTHGEAERPLV
jgi:hypothetical protein